MYSLANAYSLSIPAEIISDTNFVFIFFIQNVDHVINWGKMRIKLYGIRREKLEAGKPKTSAKRKHWDFNWQVPKYLSKCLT